MKADVKIGAGTLTAYYETDFLNRPPQEPYRFRQYFGQYSIGGWDFSAGQEWSLMRPSRAGITTIAQLMNTRVVDAGYQVGLLGYRDRQVRVLRHMGDWQAAVSFENGHDVLPKIAHDSNLLHWELTGIAGAAGHHGGSFAAVVHASRRMDIVTQQSWVRGGGKDALGTVPAGVATSATLEGIEAKPGLGILLYGYAGLVYGARSPGNREVHEGTLGFSHQIARDRIGPTVIGAQISQVDRAVWTGAHGVERFTMVSLRHYLNSPQ
jgi:hypothetical protein